MRNVEIAYVASLAISGRAQVDQLISWLSDIAIKHGYLGVFIISLVGTTSIIFPVPYTAVIFMLGGLLDPKLLALSAGAGAALGEMLGYLVGYYGGSLISERRRRKMEPIINILKRYGAIAVFIFALTPLPDDLIIIPLGITRVPPVRVLAPCLLGKISMCFILAYGGKFVRELMAEFIGGPDPIIAIVMLALLTAIVVAMIKIDWEKLLLKREQNLSK